MDQDLRVSITQTSLQWQDRDANLDHITKMINGHGVDTDLIILPEMFTSGFTLDPEPVAEPMHGLTMQWMAQMAKTINAAITGSIVILEDAYYYNRLIWMNPDGSYHYYDKRHLFAMAGEHLKYTPGQQKTIINYRGWRFCPMICYDLRFPVWSRSDADYDVLIYVANWPDRRIDDWRSLLKARAIENQAYTIGVNRIGEDPNGNVYSGDSIIYAPSTPEPLYHSAWSEGISTLILSKEDLDTRRKKHPFLQDRDRFQLGG